MSKNADSFPGRTENLIPLVREAFGHGMTLYADSNSSYDVPRAIEVGRLMEKYNYGFFEEPCRFDHLDETKQVADALTIPVAGGEQEFSEHGFRWMILNRAVDVVQPDLHYYGGFIRSIRVARMAHEADLTCTPHMSGSGLGTSTRHTSPRSSRTRPVPRIQGRYRYPGPERDLFTQVRDGTVRVPSGPGFGITSTRHLFARRSPSRPSDPVTPFPPCHDRRRQTFSYRLADIRRGDRRPTVDLIREVVRTVPVDFFGGIIKHICLDDETTKTP